MRLPTILFFVLMSILVSCTKAFAFDVGTNYNSANMSYAAGSTISQYVVLDNTMRSASSITFTVDAHGGGGRPLEHDTGNIRLTFYNSSGTQLYTQQTNYSQNLTQMNAWSTAPGDNSAPWVTISMTVNSCGGDCSSVAYMKVEMIGTDGSWWAGDYGAQWRLPTLTISGDSTNRVYNPEFGSYGGTMAQGWNSTTGWGACGTTSGSVMCTTQATGVTANISGGGYSATGGTTSGTAGGYTSTLTIADANAGTGGGASTTPTVTVTGTTTTYTYRSVVTSPGVTSVYRTPVTTTTYSDGTSTLTNGTETLYQTKVASTVTTNTISGTTLTTINTPINTVTPADGSATFVESNGTATSTSQTIQRGLNFQVWRYDPKNYSCVLGICAWNFTYHTPSTNRNNYGNPVNSGVTLNGIFIATNSDLPNNDNSLIGANDGTVMRYYGTITAPITTAHPAGSVYRLYFYNNTDDGFVLRINGNTIINQNDTIRYQAIVGTTSSGWMDVVAGQTYNIEAWYWNTTGGFGNTFYWDYGAGLKTISNNAYTTGTLTDYTVDTSGFVYSNSSVVNITGSTVNLGPTVEGGTITMTNSTGQEVIGSGSGSINISTGQQTKVDTWHNSTKTYNNALYIDQVSGNYNNITVTQSGGPNKIEMTLSGTGSNTVNLTQSGSNYLNTSINGQNNSLTTNQSNTGGSHYVETTILGSSNTINHTQSGNANQLLFSNISGSSNTVTSMQSGTAQHYLNVNLTGNGHTVTSNQTGGSSNNANLDLTNSGGASNVDLQQTGGKSFNLIQSCTNPAGCTTVVRQ